MNRDTRRLGFTFTGSESEYFKIWIVNVLLTILTLGMYSAWATVRTKRYFYGNTWLDGANFEYHATPMQILPSRIMALTLLGIYVFLVEFYPMPAFVMMGVILLMMPWLLWGGLKFNANVTSFRNVRFIFDGTLHKLYLIALIVPLLAFLVIVLVSVVASFELSSMFEKSSLDVYPLPGEDLKSAQKRIGNFYKNMYILNWAVLAFVMLTPLYQKLYAHYRLNHLSYGMVKLKADFSVFGFYKIYFKWVFLGVIAYAAFGPLFGFLMMVSPSVNNMYLVVILLMYLVFFWVLSSFMSAYLSAGLHNYIYNSIIMRQQGTENDFRTYSVSTVSTWELTKLYMGNALLMLFSLGLAYPVVKVRMARFVMSASAINVYGDFERYVSHQAINNSALGDEVSDAFDLDPSASALI